MCADSVLPLKSRMAIGKIRHVLTDLNGRLKHIPDTAADEGPYLVLATCAFTAAPLLQLYDDCERRYFPVVPGHKAIPPLRAKGTSNPKQNAMFTHACCVNTG